MLVSVITPTYNRSKTLSRAAQSVFAQNYDPIEYIIVNDGSTDDTDTVVNQFDFTDLRYIKLNENQGVSVARNKGIEAANGRYILFVDADDELRESAISTLVNELNTTPETCAGVFGQELHYKDSGDITRSTYNIGEVRYKDLIEDNCMGAFGGKLLRRQSFEALGGLDPAFPSSEDFDFFMRVATKGCYFKGIDELIYNRYYHEDRLYGDTDEKIAGMIRILEKHGDELTPQHRAYRMRIIGHTYATKNQMAQACYWFRKCISTYPFRPHYYVRFTLSKLGIYNQISDLRSFIRMQVE